MANKLLMQQDSREPFLAKASTPKPLRVDSGGINIYVLTAITSCLLGSCLPAGYCLGVINTPQAIIRSWMRESLLIQYGTDLSSEQELTLWAIVVSLFVGGAIVGASLGPFIADCAGRRVLLLMNHLLTVASGVLLLGCRSAGSIEMLVLGRFTSGLFAGVATWLVPLYLCEVGPSELQGVMGVTLPLGLSLGLIISQIIGMDSLLGTVDGWPYLLGGFLVLVVLAILLHPFLPESPTYYFTVTHDLHRGMQALKKVRGKNSKRAEAEAAALEVLGGIGSSEGPRQKWGLWGMLRGGQYRMALIITIVLNAGQQLAGINAVFYYSTLIFRSAGLDQGQSQAAAIGAGTINFIMAVSAIPLIKSCRRRVLLLVSLLGCVLSQLVLMLTLYLIPYKITGVPYLAILSLMAFVLLYGVGLGPVPFMVATELFPAGPRSVGISMGGATNWGSNLVVGLTFPLLQECFREFSFTIFIISSCFIMIFVYKFVPETLSKDSAWSPASEEERVSEDASDSVPKEAPSPPIQV